MIVALKGTQNGALFLFKDLSTTGSLFEGTFDMTKAGLIAGGSGGGGGLSNLSVAGVFVDNVNDPPPPPAVPVPASLPLLLAGLGGLSLLRRRASRKG